MKKEIHPDYNYVVFKDSFTGHMFLTRSTRTSEETTKWEDGNEYPLVSVEISSDSHPFYTGKEKHFKKEGRVEKFRRKYQKKLRQERDRGRGFAVKEAFKTFCFPLNRLAEFRIHLALTLTRR